MGSIGKMLIIGGVIAIVLGVSIVVAGKIPWLGKLPGDIVIKRDQTTVYIPLMTCFLVSIVLSIAMRFFARH